MGRILLDEHKRAALVLRRRAWTAVGVPALLRRARTIQRAVAAWGSEDDRARLDRVRGLILPRWWRAWPARGSSCFARRWCGGSAAGTAHSPAG